MSRRGLCLETCKGLQSECVSDSKNKVVYAHCIFSCSLSLLHFQYSLMHSPVHRLRVFPPNAQGTCERAGTFAAAWKLCCTRGGVVTRKPETGRNDTFALATPGTNSRTLFCMFNDALITRKIVLFGE